MSSPLRGLTQKWKQRLKAFVSRRLLSYGPKELEATVRRLGLREGDVVMVHSAWSAHNGFRGAPRDAIAALESVVTRKGVLAMPTMPTTGTSREWLESGKPMDVRRTPSQMGLLSEVFRRGRDVQRSLSPTHPIVAWGDRAEAFLAGHEKCRVPFGAGSPFARLLELDGKLLGLGAGFESFTFSHFLEDRLGEKLPCPLFEPGPRRGTVIDEDGRSLEVEVLVLGEIARRLRRESRLEAALERDGLLKRARVGNTRLLLAECRPFAECVDRMTARGESFFDAPA